MSFPSCSWRPARHKPMLHSVGDYHQRGVGWRHSTPGGPSCDALRRSAMSWEGGGHSKWFQSKHSLPNLPPRGRSPEANRKIGNRWKTKTLVGLLVCLMKLSGWKSFSLQCTHYFLLKDSTFFCGVWTHDMYRPESSHVCTIQCAHTHSRVGLHSLSSPPALFLFVDSIKQMVRKPITHGGMKWNCVCMCVDMCVLLCAWPLPSPAGFSGVSCHPMSRRWEGGW